MQSTASLFTRQSRDLLSFEEIRTRLHLNYTRHLGLQDVELDKIVGSVGRYVDFDREFLPKHDSQEDRWRRIYDLSTGSQGFPPIELYKIGDVYFVRDGNHRVSVARANKSRAIEAYVIEYLSPVNLTPDMDLDEALTQVGETNFLKVTRLNETRPQAHLRLTNPGRYKLLLSHIAGHKYFKQVEQSREMSFEEAAMSWYDTEYLPVVQEIRERDILSHFPDRTETDLYAWLALHRAALEKVYGTGNVAADEMVDELEEAEAKIVAQELAVDDDDDDGADTPESSEPEAPVEETVAADTLKQITRSVVDKITHLGSNPDSETQS